MKAIVLDRFGDESVSAHRRDRCAFARTARSAHCGARGGRESRRSFCSGRDAIPPPPGTSEIIGLECAGIVRECGTQVLGWARGDRVMALLPGGGYAEEVVVDAGSAIHIPTTISDDEAAAIPEVFLTVFLTIFQLAKAQEGESVLIHGGGSGIGTAATTLCKLAGMRVVVTAGSDEKCALCLEHGADLAINYRTEDFTARANGVNVILDHIGASYLPRDLQTLAVEVVSYLSGRWEADAWRRSM